MKNKTKTNHQDTQNPASSKIGLELAINVSDKKYGATSDFSKNHGVPAIATVCSDYSSKMFEHPVKVSLRTLTGFKPLSLAVLMMVMMIDTLRFPRSVIFPKVILRNKTAFMMPCSAGLLVGDIIGYLRNTNISPFKVINLLRMLSVSWCLSSGFTSNLLNRLNISFFMERYSSLESAEVGIMKTYRILKQVFDFFQKSLGDLVKFFIFEQFSDVTQQMRKAFLLGERSNLTAVSAPEICYEYSVVKLHEMVDDYLRTTALVNMENRVKRVRDKRWTRVGGHFQINIDSQLCQYSY